MEIKSNNNTMKKINLISPSLRHLSRLILYTIHIVFRRTCFASYFQKLYENYVYSRYILVRNCGNSVLKVNNLFFPLLNDASDIHFFVLVLKDTFHSYLYYNDVYSKDVFDELDQVLPEGLCFYKDNIVDATINEGDIVFDAGSWIGDFACYAAVEKSATVYAFEPMSRMYDILEQTVSLNVNASGKIIPVKKALGDTVGELYISTDKSGGNEITNENECAEKIVSTTIDSYCRENDIRRLDFIKADIEGFERNMLRGAQNTLRTLAPKLSICTYHLPDDPEVLESIIKNANPDYIVVHSKSKLFASVPKTN